MEEIRNILLSVYQLKKEIEKTGIKNNIDIDVNFERIIFNIETILERRESDIKHEQNKISDNMEIIKKYF